MNFRTDWLDSTTSSDLFYTKEETIFDVVENFNYRRYYSAEGKSVSIDGNIEQVIIQNHSNPINENKIDKKMLVSIDSSALSGSYVVHENQTWMIISNVNNVDDAYKTCQIQQCNYTLLFQSPDGTILSYPCIDESTNTIGIDENKVLSTSDGVHKIKLPFDSNTKLLREDRRFFLDKDGTKTAKVTHVNNIEYNYGEKGLIVLTMQEDAAYNPETDKNGVCNYFSPIPQPPVGDTYSKFTLSGTLIIDGKRTVTATAYNADGTVNTGVSLVWVITKATGFESEITCTVVGNTCTVQIVEDYEIIGRVIKFEVSDGSGGYVGSQEFKISA